MTEAYMTEASSSRSTSTGNTGKDPRLDTTAWRVFGRRLPRRWSVYARIVGAVLLILFLTWWFTQDVTCLLYTSDAADDLLCVDLGGRRIIKKKKKKNKKR